MLGIYDEDDDEDAKQMVRDITGATRADRKTMKEDDEAENIIRRVAKGEKVDVESETKDISLKWMKRIRAAYKGHVIRRTGESLDNTGKMISDLVPMRYHNLVLKLFDEEMKHITYIAEQLAQDKPQGGVMFAGGKVRLETKTCAPSRTERREGERL